MNLITNTLHLNKVECISPPPSPDGKKEIHLWAALSHQVVASTVTPLDSKNVLPLVFVTRAPPRPVSVRNTGCWGAAASSSERVGKRLSANPLRFQPPAQVMNSPGGTV